MDFYPLIDKLKPNLNRLVKILNDEMVSPELRKSALTAAFTQIGNAVYGQTYNMAAWDMEIIETIGRGIDPLLAQGLARNMSDGIAVGNIQTTMDQVKNYVMTSNSTALFDASSTAGQLGKYRVVTRSLQKETCGWCKMMVGRYINPTNEVFRRHTNCDCRITVQGYKSRNGEVKNYRNP